MKVLSREVWRRVYSAARGGWGEPLPGWSRGCGLTHAQRREFARAASRAIVDRGGFGVFDVVPSAEALAGERPVVARPLAELVRVEAMHRA